MQRDKEIRSSTPLALLCACRGMKALEAAQLLVRELQLEGQLSPEDFLKQRESILDELFAKAPLLPGVERLLRHLHTEGVPQVRQAGRRGERRGFEDRAI